MTLEGHAYDGSVAVLNQSHATYNCMQLEESLHDGVMGLHSSDEILFLPNEDLVSQIRHKKYLVDHDNILILSPNNTWLPSYPHNSTFGNYFYRSFGKMLIFCWQLVHVARNAGISKILFCSSFWNIT